MEIRELLTTFKNVITEWNAKEVKGEGFNFIDFINRFWGIGETKHSQILGFFLNPRENHGQGGLFLKLFLEKLGFDTTTFNPNDWAVEVEQRSNGRDQIDILIQSCALGVSIVIENKSNGAEDQQHQLYRYWESAIYQFHNNKEKALDPKHSRIVYLPKWGIPSEQTRMRIEGYKEPYPEKLDLEDQGGIISCWTYYTHIVEWLNKCIEAMRGENHIVKQLVKNYVEYWSSLNSKNEYYMNGLAKELESKEDWLTMGEVANTMDSLRNQWAEEFSKQLANIECHPDFSYNKWADDATYYNDFRWTYGGNWGDLALIYEPHKGFSIWKAGAGKAREWYKERLERVFPDFVISQDNNTNYLMHLKGQNEIILCNSEDKDDIFLWEYHKKGEQVCSFLAEKLKNYTNNQEVQSLFKEINEEWKTFNQRIENIAVGEDFYCKKCSEYIDYRWALKGSNPEMDLVFMYYPYYQKGLCLWKRGTENKKDIYRELLKPFFEDFEWVEGKSEYIMLLKDQSITSSTKDFVKSNFSAPDIIEKLSKVLIEYTQKAEVVKLFKEINKL
ncbi:MAG: PD-(D/E)XK nuclease family protein [Capnocytophaga sp.]|nr:PD-(D/E)XK nuclease family protein [Capnocytophaga sp.]